MALRVEELSPQTLPAARRLCEAEWGPRSEAWYRWRFLEVPSLTTWLALQDGECCAMVSAMGNTWRVGGQPVRVHEIFDWVAAAAYRRKGVGIQVLQHVMALGAPVMTLGGSEDTRRILPRLGWTTAAQGRAFALPLRARFIADRLRPRGRALALAGAATMAVVAPLWFRPRRARPPGGVILGAVPAFDPSELADLYRRGGARFALVATIDPATLEWAALGSGPGAPYLLLELRRGSTLAGIAVARVVDGPGPRPGPDRRGELSEVFTAEPDDASAALLAGHASAWLAELGAEAVITTATDERMQRVLARCRFIAGSNRPLLLFVPPGRALPPGRVHVMRQTADHIHYGSGERPRTAPPP